MFAADDNQSPHKRARLSRETLPPAPFNDNMRGNDQASSTAAPTTGTVTLNDDHAQAATARCERLLSHLSTALSNDLTLTTEDLLTRDMGYDEVQRVIFHQTREGDLALVEKLFRWIKKMPSGTDTIARLVRAEDETGFTLLMTSARNDAISICELLVAEGANVNHFNAKRPMALQLAAQKGHPGPTRFLLEHGATDKSKNLALIPAAHFGHLDVVRVLLEFGADQNYSNKKGTTPLMRAAQEGRDEVVQFLIDKGARVDVANHEGMTALMLASQRDHASIATFLIHSGANINKQTRVGSTALMLAAKRGLMAAVEALLAAGADISLEDERRKTAAEVAHRRGHKNVSLKIASSARQTCRL